MATKGAKREARPPRLDSVKITAEILIRLKSSMEKEKLNQTYLADRTGIKRTTVNRIVKGNQKTIERRELVAWGRATGVGAVFLEFGDTIRPSGLLSAEVAEPFDFTKALSELFRKANALPPNRSGGIQELTLLDFLERGVSHSDIAKFLQGEPPTPWLAINGAVPRQIAVELVEVCSDVRALLLHGSIGEGTSTTLLQVAHLAVKSGRRVLRVASVDALSELPNHSAWSQHPLIIFDDAHRLEKLPAWLEDAFPSERQPTLLLGTQTRRRMQLTNLFYNASEPLKICELPKVTVADSSPFIKLIIEQNAARPDLSAAKIVELFEDGLSRYGNDAGLWPAQFQATRGALLDERVRDLLSDSTRAAVARVISVLAFYGMLVKNVEERYSALGRVSLEQTIISLNLDSRAEAECLVALRNIARLLEGELLYEFGYQEFEQRNNRQIELRHPALAECLFRRAFGSVKRTDQPLFDKWPYYLAAIKAIGNDSSKFAPDLVYGVLMNMRKVVGYDLKRKGVLRERLTSNEYPHPEDRVIHALNLAEMVIGSPFTDGGRYSRRLNMMKVRSYLNKREAMTADDEARARDRLNSALANAVRERDLSILRKAARAARDLNYTTAEGDWRALIETAERLEPSASTHPKRALHDYIDIALSDRRSRDFDSLFDIIDRAQLSHPDWDIKRLGILQRLLNLVRRDNDEGVRYLIPRSFVGERLNSIRAIYQALWRELWRRDEQVLDIRQSLEKGESGQVEVLTKLFKLWAEDFQEGDGSWPQGVMRSVKDVNPDSWLNFIRSYPDYYPS